MKNCPVLLLLLAACALVAASAPASAQTGNTALDKAMNAVKRLEQSPAAGPTGDQPTGRRPDQPVRAERPGPGTPNATGSTNPGSNAMAVTFDPMAPPKRLVGTQGVRLGATVEEASALLKSRGWLSMASDAGWTSYSQWSKGQLRLLFKASPSGSPHERIHSIRFYQSYENPAEGQFNVDEVRRDLIARYGPPRRELLPQMLWSESPPHAVSSRATMDAQLIMGGAPKLDAMLLRNRVELLFKWANLEFQPAREELRRQKNAADNAPKTKVELD